MDTRTAIEAIDALEKFGMKLGLERIEACLRQLGDPQNAYPTLHVGGTNGKGSTSLLLAEALTASGYRTGLYTSPPLESFGERIRVDGAYLPEGEIPPLLEAVRGAEVLDPRAAGMTQFEVITAMAFVHFARVGVDGAVIEVGLGGRLDSTNVLQPEVSVITNVGLEHAEHLGGTEEAVAREKSGIIKPGVPVVSAARGAAARVVEEESRRRGSPLYLLGRDFTIRGSHREGYRFEGRSQTWEAVELGLLGSYQRENLGLTLAALEVLGERGWSLPENDVRPALAKARWPGRAELLGAGPRVLLDGAHNPHASRALAETLRAEIPFERLILVLGILGDKDARSILGDLLPLADFAIVTRSSSARSVDPAVGVSAVRALSSVPVEAGGTVDRAVERALELADPGDLVCVTGSLTTVGEARTHLRKLGWLR